MVAELVHAMRPGAVEASSRTRFACVIAAVVVCLCAGAPASAGAASGHSITAGESHTCAALATGHVECWGLERIRSARRRHLRRQLHGGRSAGSDRRDAGLRRSRTHLCGGLRRPRRVLGLGPIRSSWGTAAKKPATPRSKCRASPAPPRSRPGPTTRVRCSPAATSSAGVTGSTASSATVARPLATPPWKCRESAAPSRSRPAEMHTCAVLSNGHVACWGYGGLGQLGNGHEESHDTPVEVQGISSANQVAAGDNHSCAVLSSGHVECWGEGSYGQLGDGEAREAVTRRSKSRGSPARSRSRPAPTIHAHC